MGGVLKTLGVELAFIAFIVFFFFAINGPGGPLIETEWSYQNDRLGSISEILIASD
ncbi:hypothetical protein F4814DRAFT_448526 [Daldinia grandis]|nr:hypothetical protein F4814DRAFT_448526 [Daldinia grandis]